MVRHEHSASNCVKCGALLAYLLTICAVSHRCYQRSALRGIEAQLHSQAQGRTGTTVVESEQSYRRNPHLLCLGGAVSSRLRASASATLRFAARRSQASIHTRTCISTS